MVDPSSPSGHRVPPRPELVFPQNNWHTSNLDPSDAQFILRDWLGIHRICALDRHVNFDSRNLGGLLEQAIQVSADIREDRRTSSVGDLLELLVKARILELRSPVSCEAQKIPLLLKTMMKEAMVGACARVVLAANVNRYVSDLFSRLGGSSHYQELRKSLDDGKMFGALHVSSGGPIGTNKGSGLTVLRTPNGNLALEGKARFITGAPGAEELLGCALVQLRFSVDGSPRPALVGILLRNLRNTDSPIGHMRVVKCQDSPCILTVEFSGATECGATVLGYIDDGDLAITEWRTNANLDASVIACAAATNAFRAVNRPDSSDNLAFRGDPLADLQSRVEALRTIVCALSKWSEFEPFELGALATAGLSEGEKKSIRADTANLIPFLLPMCRRFIQSEAQSIMAQSVSCKDALSDSEKSAISTSCEAHMLSSVFDEYLDRAEVTAFIQKVGAPSNETLASCFEHFRKLRDELRGVPRLLEIIDIWWKECERLETVGDTVRKHLTSGGATSDMTPLIEHFSRYFGAVLGAYWFIQHARASNWILNHEVAEQLNPASIFVPEAKCEHPQFYEGKIVRVRHFVENVVPQYYDAALSLCNIIR